MDCCFCCTGASTNDEAAIVTPIDVYGKLDLVDVKTAADDPGTQEENGNESAEDSPAKAVSRVTSQQSQQTLGTTTSSLQVLNGSEKDMSRVPSTDDAAAGVEASASLEVERRPSVEEIMKSRELSLSRLATETGVSHVWVRECIVRWRDLPLGDDCIGEKFFEAAGHMPAVYPWVFHNKYAVNFLTKDFNEHITTAKKNWPKGATTLRQAVKEEIKSKGLPAVEKAKWNTVSMRFAWILKALKVFLVIFDDVCYSTLSPVESAQRAIETVLAPYLNWALKKIAQYIVSACVYHDRNKVWERLGMSEDDVKLHMGVLANTLRPHVVELEKMLREEAPSMLEMRA